MTLYVICPDGVIRHGEGFSSVAEARKWMEWGHCCLAHGHRIIPGDAQG